MGGQTQLKESAQFPTLSAFFKSDQVMNFFISDYPRGFDGIIGNNNLIPMKAKINYGDRWIELNGHRLRLYLSAREEFEESSYDYEINNMEIQNILETGERADNSGVQAIRTSHMNGEEKEGLMKLMKNYAGLFYNKDVPLSSANLPITHGIKLTTDQPVRAASYRYPQVYEAEVERQITEMLNQGIIRKSTSPYNAPIWIVDKKADASGLQKKRIVVDYRKLNEVTVEESFPIPTIDEQLSKLGNSLYFTTLDLAKGFVFVCCSWSR